MFVLKCNIEITPPQPSPKEREGFVFTQITDVEIVKSVEELQDTCIIKLPTKFKVKSNNEQKYTEEVIKVGDEVKVTLGYDGVYEGVEFKGFVKKVSPKIPLEIHCEDAIWLLRRKNINKTFAKTTMKAILQEVVKDTPLQLADNIPDVPLEKWTIRNANGTQVLESLKKDLSMTIFLNDEGKLYCGLQQLTNIGQEVTYDLNYNLVANNLEFRTSEERKLKIKYTYIAPDNKRTSVEVGDADGEQREFHTSVVSSEAKLKELAHAELQKLKYDGYDGDVTSFLVPYATRGMKAMITDVEHLNRFGYYFIKKVVTTFGSGGARRVVSIGSKL